MSKNQLALLLGVPWLLYAASPARAEGFSAAISDNSFFIEEAYNQEPRVVQHILTGLLPDDGEDGSSFSFTQEWPAGSLRHQLSFTLTGLRSGSPRREGLGDTLINYRYQWRSDERTAVAPRVSVVLPTGDVEDGFGDDSFGLQVNLPVSHRLAESWVVHANLGATWLPDARAETAGPRRALTSAFLGGSVIWLLKPKINGLFEVLTSYDGEIVGRGRVEHSRTTVVSPGLRGAIDVGELQIVPGIALPWTFGEDEDFLGVFLYLSFEHPF